MPHASRSQARPARPSGAINTYLTIYNLLSLLLWTSILLTILSLWPTAGPARVWHSLHLFARWVETASALEVLHAALGLVRASPLTTALQIAGRNTVVWAIARNYPEVVSGEWAYASMLLAWSLADVVRYGYFTLERATGRVPGVLRWIRYNMFFVLYPPGILSECWLVYKVIKPSRERRFWYEYLLWLGLAIYVPASYILFAHMMAQRRKMGRKQGVKEV